MIKASTLNFVRDKADEGAQWAELHAQLKDIASNTQAVKAEQKRLDDIKAARVKTDAELKAAEDRVAKAHLDLEAVNHDRSNARKEADALVAGATVKAASIVADAKKTAEASMRAGEDHLAKLKSERDVVEADLYNKRSDFLSLKVDHDELRKQHQQLAAKRDQLLAALTTMKAM